MHWIIAVILVFVGCCSNLFFLELLVKDHPGCGAIITFSHFLFIAAEGLIFTSKFGTVPPKIPLRHYTTMVIMFFVVQLSNNIAFICNISVPLHTIFRSGTLMANMILGMLILKRRYPLSKYLATVLVTLGIIIYTLASRTDATRTAKPELDSGMGDVTAVLHWLSGIALLLFALFMSAGMGIYQETIYTRHGKHPTEALFYNHALPLPCFLLVATDIYQHAVAFNQSEPLVIPMMGVACPKMWLYLAGNIVTQYVCIRAVFVLTTECTSLTVTFILTMRKFFSLCVSIIYFNNQFTSLHLLGAVLVVAGTFAFINAASILRGLVTPKSKPKVQ